MKYLSLFMAALLAFSAPLKAESITEIMEKSMKAMANATHLEYHFFSKERFGPNKFENSEVKFKYQQSPLKIYAEAFKPESAKLSYIPAESDKINVKKGPLKINLSVYSNMLMKQQHHPLYKAGFGTIKGILEHNLKARGLTSAQYGEFAKIVGTVTYDGKPCWHIEINDKDYKLTTYTVKNEKDVWELGKKLAIPEFRVKQLNNISDELKAGQVLKVPSSYAKKTTVYVCKSTYLPIYQKMEDDEGLYEVFEFKSLKTGVKFTDEDFKH
jgi:hypothetical protein